MCDKITKHHHLFANFCSNKRITPEENEYLIEASKRFGNYDMKKMMAKLPSKNNPETFFELLTNWRLVYGRLSKFGKKSSTSRRLLNGIKCSREVDEILWAIFEHVEPCYTHQQLIKKIRSNQRITMSDICPWHPGNSCKCGYGTNEKGFCFGEKYLCKSDFLTGKCTCISDFLESEPIEQHKTVHKLLSELKFKIDNLKQGEVEISKEDQKLIEKQEIDIDDFDEVTTFLLKHYQKSGN